ncbi:four-carbon acid sugar kinase family protein [Ramlibacter alkalitolerans]|uniref:Four-carbon acid sugar kinase family protein n=1 Tax=Ramlibacter alkalitolerans TaxID=2039631 RepID=A0ABS1JRB9_9BURK|nr:four-carbon acid sugar kinase family protein [Ramlibacter alkalitolerans]MBL0426797.1 four-carbon acid sugar kinase family protein [Ramlibacter alkalitolerans]
MSRCLQVIADDLSGAAECAAALAQASVSPAPLVVTGPLPVGGNWVVDSDTRVHEAPVAVARVAAIVRDASSHRAGGDLLFKKIDSTLRGHLADELRAVLDVPEAVQAAIVCPALPTQGRTLRQGVLHVHGQARLDATGQPLNLIGLLAPVDPEALLLHPPQGQTAAALARELLCRLEQGTRVIVVDASDAEDLRRLALAIVIVSRSVRLLAVGAAGLCKALATELLQAGGRDHPMLAPSRDHPPIVAVIGSFSAVTTQQVDELASQADVHVARLDPSTWLESPAVVAETVATAQACAERGAPVVLAVSGTAPAASSRMLVHRMAQAAEPLLRRASTLVLTGGDTARAVLDRLGVERLQVLGELEPGICLSRDGARFVVTKAGGFGDSQSLVRVLRHLRNVSGGQPTPGNKA